MKLITSLALTILFTASSTFASDFCVTGLKGTLTSGYLFRIGHTSNSERAVALLDSNNKNVIFTSKAENRFTQFNTTGYGVCSITGTGTDAATGAQYKVEMKLSSHYKAECNQAGIPTSVEYLTLKITPKGTTLGDDLTAYALSTVPCP